MLSCKLQAVQAMALPRAALSLRLCKQEVMQNSVLCCLCSGTVLKFGTQMHCDAQCTSTQTGHDSECKGCGGS